MQLSKQILCLIMETFFYCNQFQIQILCQIMKLVTNQYNKKKISCLDIKFVYLIALSKFKILVYLLIYFIFIIYFVVVFLLLIRKTNYPGKNE